MPRQRLIAPKQSQRRQWLVVIMVVACTIVITRKRLLKVARVARRLPLRRKAALQLRLLQLRNHCELV